MDLTKHLRTDHAVSQALARYGFVPHWNDVMQRILRHEAKLVALSGQGRLIYDVPVRHERSKVVVRVVVDAARTYVITVLPDEFRSVLKRMADKDKRRKQKYFREAEDDDDFAVTV
jgi:hypothetical protein